MMYWLRKFLGLCDHKWKIYSEISVYSEGTDEHNSYPVFRKIILQCEHCGNLKKVKV